MKHVYAASVAALLLAVASVTGAAPRYQITDLGAETEAAAINESGTVLGNWIGLQSVWKQGTWTALETPPRFDPVAVAIVAGGVAVGYVFENQGQDNRERAFAWRPDGRGYVLKTGLGGQSYATAVSNEGTIVGGYRAKGVYHAYAWKAGTLSDLGVPAHAVASVATAIDRDGTLIAGVCGFEDHTRQGFLYVGGAFTLIGDVTGAEAGVTGVNRNGEAVGASYKQGGRHPRAFLYEHGKRHFLGTLGGFESRAQAINGDGVVVGDSRDAKGHERAFVYQDGQMQALDGLVDHLGGLRLQHAAGINNAGQVVGTAIDADGATHGYLLDPLP
jgi:probable HAF family extracellular repeat protein